MGLIQTGFLAAMAALAIPVLVHLLSRWQVRRLEFGTMQFLQEVIHDSAYRRRLRRWLLLSTRLLVVALLALLFARPFIPDRAPGDGERLRLVLVDRSASMSMAGQSGRLLDDAIAAGLKAVEQAGPDTQVEWAWFDRHVEPLAGRASRPETPRSTSGDTSYFAALSWARDRLISHPSNEAEVVLVTDLQQSGLAHGASGSELGFPSHVPVRVIDVGRTAANNLAIVGLSTGAARVPQGRPVVVTTTLFNYGALPAEEVPITASANNGQRSVRLKKSLSVLSEQAEEVSFDFGDLEFGTWQITVDIDLDDDLLNDNRRLTAVEVAKPFDVLVVDPGADDGLASPVSYFLVTALQQGSRFVDDGVELTEAKLESDFGKARFRRFAIDVIYLEDSSLAIGEQALVVVADAGSLSPRMIEQLEAYVHRGGRALVFAGSQISQAVAAHWGQAGLAPGRLTRPENAAAMPFRIVSISSQGSMLEPFRDPQHGDLGRLAFSSLMKTDIDATTQVLAWFDDQRPAITQHALGTGKVAWFLSSADNSAGNWTSSPLYLPLVQQMAADLLGLTGEGPIRFRAVGDTLSDTSLNAAMVRRSARSAVGRPKTRPAKTRRSEPSEDLESVAEGMYLDRPGFRSEADALFVVNMSAQESDPTRIDVSSLADQLQLTLADGDGRPAKPGVESASRNELWPWLAAALVLFLVLEFSLSNRTPA